MLPLLVPVTVAVCLTLSLSHDLVTSTSHQVGIITTLFYYHIYSLS